MTRLEELLGPELVAAIRGEIRAELEAASGAPDRLLSVDEAAAQLGLGRTMLYSLIGRGAVKSVRAGRRRLIPQSALSAYAREAVG